MFRPRVLVPCVVMLMSVCLCSYSPCCPTFGEYGHSEQRLVVYCLTAACCLCVLWGAVHPIVMDGGLSWPFLIAMAMLVTGICAYKTSTHFGCNVYGFCLWRHVAHVAAWATDLSDEHHKGRGVAWALYFYGEWALQHRRAHAGMGLANDPSNFILTFSIWRVGRSVVCVSAVQPTGRKNSA